MNKEKLKSPLERMLKKSYEEMTKSEFNRIKLLSSLVTGFLFSFFSYLWDGFSGHLKSVLFYIFSGIFFAISWYFLFWFIFCKKRKIRK